MPFLAPVGRIQGASGRITIARGDAVVAQAPLGELLYEGDQIETGIDGQVDLLLIDGTTFQLFAASRVVLDRFSYFAGKSDNVGRLRVQRGKFGFIAGKVATSGNFAVETPLSTIRSTASAVGLGTLAFAFVLGLIHDAQGSSLTEGDPTADEDITFIDDGTIVYKDLEHGIFEIVTNEQIPRVIVVDDPGQMVILHSRGSSISVEIVSNTSTQMLVLQGAYQTAFATYLAGQSFTQQFAQPLSEHAGTTIIPTSTLTTFLAQIAVNTNTVAQTHVVTTTTTSTSSGSGSEQSFVTLPAIIKVLPISNDQHQSVFLGPADAAHPNAPIVSVVVPFTDRQTLVSVHITGLPDNEFIYDRHGHTYSGPDILIKADDFLSGLTLSAGVGVSGTLHISATVLGPGGPVESTPVDMPLTLDLSSAVHWINSNGGDWNEPTNWSTGAIPIPFEDVIIDAPGTYTVTSSHNVSIDSVLVASGATLKITSSTFELTTANAKPLQNAGTIIVGTGATFTVGDASFAGTAVNTGTLQASDGGAINIINLAVTSTGTVQVDANSTLRLQTVSIDGSNLGTLTIHGLLKAENSTANSIENFAVGHFSNDGQILVTGASTTLTLLNDVLDNSNGHITVAALGTLTLDQTIINHGDVTVAKTGTDLGTLDLVGAAVLENGSFTNHGTVDVTGTLNKLDHQTVSNDGTITVEANADLTIVSSGTVDNSNGHITVEANADLTIDTTTIDGGTIANGGLITIANTATLEDGITVTGGNMVIGSAGHPATLHIENGTGNAGATLIGVTVDDAFGSVNVDAAGGGPETVTLVLADGTTITGGNLAIGAVGGSGLLEIQSGTHNAGATLVDVAVTNQFGVIQIDNESNLLLSGGSKISDGSVTVGAQSTLEIGPIIGATLDDVAVNNGSGSALPNNYGTVQVDAAATLTLDHATSITGGDITILADTQAGMHGEIDTYGVGIIFTDTEVTNDGVIEIKTGSLKITGSIGGSGYIQIDANALFELDASDTQEIRFAGGNAELEIDRPSFNGTISGLASTDEIDLRTLDYDPSTTATYTPNANPATGGTLIVTHGADSISLALVGADYSHAHFAGSDDGFGHHTLITLDANDSAPAIATADKAEGGSLSELSNPTGSTAQDNSSPPSGTIHFTDVNLTDRPLASITAQTFIWLAANGTTDLTPSLTPDEELALGDALQLSQAGANNGTIVWTYSVTDKELDFLAANETLAVTSTVTINDSHPGGTDTATVTITITGSNDLPKISTAVGQDAGSVTEAGLQNGGNTPFADTPSATGTLSSTDTDHNKTATWSGNATSIYGSFVIDPTSGVWTYNLDNTAGSAADHLKAGEVVQDQFTATVTDDQGATTTDIVTITITGTNDAPVIQGGNQTGSVTEDVTTAVGPGQFTASDVDHDATQTWQVWNSARTVPGTVTHSADYLFAIDDLVITRSGSPLVHDDFSTAPVTGPTYNVNQGSFYFGPDSNGRTVAFLDAADGSPATGIDGVTNDSITATRLTGTNSTTNPSTLTKEVAFTVAARFDLTLPNDLNEGYGIRLTDRTSSIPANDDELELRVVKNSSGGLQVQLRDLDHAHNTASTLQSIGLNQSLPPTDQIVLKLNHDANSDNVTASFEIYDASGSPISTTSFTTLGQVFNKHDSADFTQAQIFANSPATDNSYFTGQYGTLTSDPTGAWSYGLLNASSQVQALAAGQVAHDIFTIQVMDDHDAIDTKTVDITVNGTNDAPVLITSASPALTAVNEDTLAPTNSSAIGSTLVSALVDLNLPPGGNDNVTDVDSGAVTGMAITAADETNGTWYYTTDGGSHWTAIGAVSNASALLLAADANTRVYFAPNANYNGTATVTFRAWDETSGTAGTKVDTSSSGGATAFSIATDTASITVNAVNDAPAGTSATLTLLEDGSHSFAAADFGFTDPVDATNGAHGADHFQAVIIHTLPAAGTLKLSGVDVTADQSIPVANIPNLVYTPAANANGAGYASLTFQVVDDGGTANGGQNTDQSPNTLTFDVTAVNDAPVISSQIVVMDPTHNDGSFESNSVVGVNQSPTTLAPVWTITSTGEGGLLSNPPHSAVLAGADGADALFADTPNSSVPTESTTATSYNLLGTTYPAVHAGDVIAWSFEINSWSATSTGTLKLNFGGDDVTVGTGTAIDDDLSTFQTISGTYTATAADAAGGQLKAILSITTGTADPASQAANVYGDNVHLTVLPATSVQEDSSINITTLRVTDVDAGTSPLKVTLHVDHGAVALTDTTGVSMVDGNGSDGTLSFTGTQSAINTALAAGVQYNPGANYNGSDTLTTTVDDQGATGTGGAQATSSAVALTVTPVNDAPVLANAIADQSVTEDTAWSYQVPANAFSDVDSALTYVATLGNDAALPSWLSFNVSTRTFEGTPPSNFSGTIDLKVTASDGSLTASDTFTLNVTPVADAPVAPPAGEFRVNSTTSSTQSNPSVAALSDGGYVVVWQSLDQDGSANGIYAQRYDASGATVGSEFRVNEAPAGDQQTAWVAGLNNGGFVVTWSVGDSWDQLEIYGRVFGANGSPVSGDIHFNTYTESAQSQPTVTALSGGGFVGVWSSYDQDGSGATIIGQRFAADGTKIGGEFQVNTFTYYEQYSPAVAATPTGGFVVVWQSTPFQEGDGSDIYRSGIYGQRFDADGQPLGTEFHVNTTTAGEQQEASVAVLSDGSFVVAWHSADQDGSGLGIYAQRFSANGTPQGGEFQVNSYTDSDQSIPTVAALPNGGFLVTWVSNGQDGSGTGIYGQAYDANGNAAGSEFRVSESVSGEQTVGSDSIPLAVLNSGYIVHAWYGAPELSGSEIYAKQFALTFGAEDTPISIPTAFRLADTDGSETLTLSASAIPIGATISDGAGGHSFTASAGSTSVAITGWTLGALTVTPPQDFNGSFSLTLSATATESDGSTATTTRTFDVAVTPVNDAPVAGNDSASGNEDTPIANINVLANDSDVDNTLSAASISAFTQAAHGAVVKNGDGTFTYTPVANYNGGDSFTYTVTDGSLTSTATVNVTVNAVNDAPGVTDNPTYLKFGAAASATGSSPTSNVGNSAGDGVTIAGWFNWNGGDNVAHQQVLLYNGNTSNAGFGLNGSIQGGKLDLQYGAGGIGNTDTHVSLNADQWYNIAMTRVGGQFTLYVDGANVFSSSTSASTFSSGDNLMVGGLLGGQQQFNGAIGDVSVWNTALTQAQIQGIKFTSLSGAEANLVGYYPLNDGSGPVAVDLVSSAGNLTVSGSPIWAVNNADNWLVNGVSTNEDTSLRLTALNVSDIDANGAAEEVTLSVGHGSLALGNASGVSVTANGSSGTLTFSGTIAQLNAALASGVTFAPTSNFNGADALAITVNDLGHSGGTAQSGSQTISITVNAVNDAPIVTSVSGDSAGASKIETNSGVFATGTATVLDPDASDVVTVAIGDPDPTQPDHGVRVFLVPTPPVGQSAAPANFQTPGVGLQDADLAPYGLTKQALLGFFSIHPTGSHPSSDPYVHDGTAGTLTWTFDSGSQAFDFLDAGQTLLLYYPSLRPDDGHTITPIGDGAIFVRIDGTNDAPVAAADSLLINSGATLGLSSALKFNDDRDGGDTFNIVAVGNANHGTVALNGGNPIFTPDIGYIGTASFKYWISDAASPPSPGAFGSAVTYGVGSAPSMVHAADVNGDGNMDVIATNLLGNSVSVLVGNGNGTFQAQSTYATGPNPNGFATGDIDNDGNADIVVANYGSNNVSILKGNGDGTFQTQTTTSVGNAPYDVRLADLNGDGKLDLIATSTSSDNVAVLLGNGNGTFGTIHTYATDAGPTDIALADVNGDGKIDIVTSNSYDVSTANDVSVLLGNGDGTFQPQQTFGTGSHPHVTVDLADLNKDGFLDIVTADRASNAVSVLLGNGNGTFQTHVDYAVGSTPYSVEIVDVNEDGNLDLVAANSGGNTLSVLLGNGNGTFQSQSTYSAGGNTPYYVDSGDFNNDGREDLVTANGGSNSISLLLNTPVGGTQSSATVTLDIQPGSTITGTAGADTLVSGSASQTLTGNGGADIFSFKSGFGNDIITDYTPGTDQIYIDHTVFADINALLNATQDTDGHAVITHDAAETISLNVLKAALISHTADFHFI